ncbi:MAG: hypothetical protein V3T84_07090 [Phycisphaerales bacterium]
MPNMFRNIAVIALALGGLLAGTASRATPGTPASPAAGPTEPGDRVIIRVDRHLELAGYVEDEDAELIVIRDPEDQVHSFVKSRIIRIIRLVDPKPGQRGTVVLRNGQTRQGILVEDTFEHVLLDLDGMRAKLLRETVDYVVLEPTFQQRYQQYKAGIAPNMHQQHLDLCRWLMQQRKYELAKKELVELLRNKPTPQAQRLLTIVHAQLALAKPTDRSTSNLGTDDPTAPTEDADRKAGPVLEKDLLPTEILSRQDVNAIRVFEIDFHNPPHVVVSADTIRKLIEDYGTSKLIPIGQARTALFRADSLEIVHLMFQLRARELYGEIRVQTEPHSLNLFRRRVHDSWLMNNCATSRCHGGVHAGRFFLHGKAHKDERVRYTNLLILERLDLDPQWPLINYDEPTMSLIIQYALPRTLARKPHPDVPGWKPVFTRSNQRLLQDTIQWIEAMLQPRPDYPVRYEPPQLLGTGPQDSPAEARVPR